MSTNGFVLKSVQVVCGIDVFRTSAVTLEDESGRQLVGFAEGNGPVSATYNAINDAVLSKIGLDTSDLELTEFVIRTTGDGPDAEGKAVVTLIVNGVDQEFLGTGVSTDIVAAGALAYVDALNRMLESREK